MKAYAMHTYIAHTRMHNTHIFRKLKIQTIRRKQVNFRTFFARGSSQHRSVVVLAHAGGGYERENTAQSQPKPHHYGRGSASRHFRSALSRSLAPTQIKSPKPNPKRAQQFSSNPVFSRSPRPPSSPLVAIQRKTEAGYERKSGDRRRYGAK